MAGAVLALAAHRLCRSGLSPVLAALGLAAHQSDRRRVRCRCVGICDRIHRHRVSDGSRHCDRQARQLEELAADLAAPPDRHATYHPRRIAARLVGPGPSPRIGTATRRGDGPHRPRARTQRAGGTSRRERAARRALFADGRGRAKRRACLPLHLPCDCCRGHDVAWRVDARMGRAGPGLADRGGCRDGLDRGARRCLVRVRTRSRRQNGRRGRRRGPSQAPQIFDQ